MVSSHRTHQGQLSGSVITFIPRLYVSPFSSFPPKTILLVFPVSPSSCILVTLCSLLSSDSLCFPSRHLGFCYAPIFQELPLWEVLLPDRRETLFYGNMCTNPTEVNFKHLFFFPPQWDRWVWLRLCTAWIRMLSQNLTERNWNTPQLQ